MIRLSGTLANRPSAGSARNARYYATDEQVIYFSTGQSWERDWPLDLSDVVGSLSDTLANRPRSSSYVGWIFVDSDTGNEYEAFPKAWALSSLRPVIRTAIVIIPNAQILTLPTVPVVIVPATETLNYSGFPTKLFFPTKVYGVLDSRNGVYGNVTNGCPLLAWGSDYSKVIAQGAAANWGNSPLTFSMNNVGTHLFSDFSPGLAVFSMLVLEDVTGTNDLYDNSLVLAMFNGGNLTGGDPANTLKLVVQYFEVSTP